MHNKSFSFGTTSDLPFTAEVFRTTFSFNEQSLQYTFHMELIIETKRWFLNADRVETVGQLQTLINYNLG